MNIHVETGFDGKMYYRRETRVYPPPKSTYVTHLPQKPFPMTELEHSCPYCKSIYTGFRCHSCGAPRQEAKPTYRDHFQNVHTICTTT